LSGLLLKNGDFVACVYRGLVDDYARQAIVNLAQKIFRSGSKKFSKLIIKVGDRETSAWDYYCYGHFKGSSAFQDKFVSDYLKLALVKRIEALSEEKLRLMEISACSLMEIDENTILRSEPLLKLIQAELQALLLAHGRLLQSEAHGEALRVLPGAERLDITEA
jgi:hypothetical protein